MRLNKFLALATGISRRTADSIIIKGQVSVNGTTAIVGARIDPLRDKVIWRGSNIEAPMEKTIIRLNKPVGYVCSRNGQGSQTIYSLLPERLNNLKPIGRLDKESSGLILLTNDGDFAHQLSHPSFQKEKIYEAELKEPLGQRFENEISKKGIELEDGISQMQLLPLSKNRKKWQVIIKEGRNRQIRRTFSAVGAKVIKLHRVKFGDFELGDLAQGKFEFISY